MLVSRIMLIMCGEPKKFTSGRASPNLFQFLFDSQIDLNKANGRPWLMDNQLLNLKQWYKGIEDDKKAFDFTPLWMQIWNLPAHWCTKEIGLKIGKVVGEVQRVIIPQTGSKEGKHLKILVRMDISQPLLTGTVVKDEGRQRWVNFKYERCPDFCYRCGVIGHTEKNCEGSLYKDQDKKGNQYGNWMRASNGGIGNAFLGKKKDRLERSEMAELKNQSLQISVQQKEKEAEITQNKNNLQLIPTEEQLNPRVLNSELQNPKEPDTFWRPINNDTLVEGQLNKNIIGAEQEENNEMIIETEVILSSAIEEKRSPTKVRRFRRINSSTRRPLSDISNRAENQESGDSSKLRRMTG
ncbi:hypothetical protein ACH5RR_030591 [Cinchona calisaya]|uniref:CCHC-type domain-containing protein n=1 Tax=Cinchona calisaya TaxID=153742 RepID=A0ABD2YV15_9GENT